MISSKAKLAYWGYSVEGDVLYLPLSLYIISYVLIGLFLCYRFYSKLQSKDEKKRVRLMLLSISFSFVGGVTTEAIPTILGFEIMHLTSTLSMATSIGIFYTIIKYKAFSPVTLTIKRRIIVSFLILIIFILLIGFVGYYGMQENRKITERLVGNEHVAFKVVMEIKSDILLSRMHFEQYLSTSNKAHLQSLNSVLSNVEKRFAFLESMNIEKEEKAILEDIKNTFASYKLIIESAISIYEKTGKIEDIATKKANIDALLENALIIKIDKFIIIRQETIEKLKAEGREIYFISLHSIILLSFILLVFSILNSVIIIQNLTNPIKKLKESAQKIAEGTFDVKVDIATNDEFGELASAFNEMSAKLKKYHEQEKKYAEELEQKVAERMKELKTKVDELTKTKDAMLNMMEDMEETNKKLKETQEALEKSMAELKELDAKKDQFISIAAHELKTPLASIHGFAQLLQSKDVAKNAEKRNKYLNIIVQESMRLAKLVNDILNLSRIDLGTLKIEIEEIDIRDFIGKIKTEMKGQIESKNLKSEFIIDKACPKKIRTDREKLTEIMINLISNAIKYTPKGKITVKVFPDKENIHFVVKDTGIGIAKEQQEKIFERFYQVDSSYTRSVGGAGLGLAICKEYATLLGGRIWVESELGKGSEFHVILPLKGPKETPAKKADFKKPIFKK
jgi:signal transduction histidine kinase